MDFCNWFVEQKYDEKVLVGGNHDNFLQSVVSTAFAESLGVHEDCDYVYLCDSGVEYKGLKIWGSPWTHYFVGMNPSCMAFTCQSEEELAEKWKLIPSDTDILVTHSPPAGILDATYRKYRVGSKSLRCEMLRIKPKLHVFGHIHEGYGEDAEEWGEGGKITKFVNASHMDVNYRPVNKPIRIIL